jgi:hypothetical protein
LTRFGLVFPLAANCKPMKNWRWRKYRACRPTDDPVIIQTWCDRFPDHNWALVPTKSFVLDIDMKNGKDGLASALAAGGLTPTMIVRTPSGGFHYYYLLDQSIPFLVCSGIVTGVDVRYGSKGFVVAPFSVKENGVYELLVRVESLPDGILSPIPAWIRPKVQELMEIRATRGPRQDRKRQKLHPKTNPNPDTMIQECKSQETPFEESNRHWSEALTEIAWKSIRPSIRFMFFLKRGNQSIWNHFPVNTMVDTTQSGYEFQLAMRLCNVGATDEEINCAYRSWCWKHRLPVKDRFELFVLKDARRKTDPYTIAWALSQPVRVKRGTTTGKILDAIRIGLTSCKAIAALIGVRANTVAVQLSRLVSSGRLVRTSGTYSLPPTSPASE